MQPKVIKQINIIARCSTLFRDFQLKGTGLSGYQAPYLPEISQNPGLTQEELAQRLHVNRSSVTRQLVLLEQEGFITRLRSKTDRRSIQVFPTQKLAEMLPRLRQINHAFRSGAAENLTAQEVVVLSSLLDKLAAGAEALTAREVPE